MIPPAQTTIHFEHNPAYAEADFLPAPCNQLALSWFAAWPDWSSFAVALTGPDGCGKSHLAHIFCHKHHGQMIEAKSLDSTSIHELTEHHGIVIEDADRGVDETALFHLFNMLREKNHFLVLTGREPPARWPLALADLRSRLASIPLVTIGPPDDNLLQSVVIKLFADRQMQIAPDVPSYIISRIERSFASLHRIVSRIDQVSLALHRPVTVHLVKNVIEQHFYDKQNPDFYDKQNPPSPPFFKGGGVGGDDIVK